jgi:hypothetical protein
MGPDQATPPALDGLCGETTRRRTASAAASMSTERSASAGRLGGTGPDSRQRQRPRCRIATAWTRLRQIEFRNGMAVAKRATASAIVTVSGHPGLMVRNRSCNSAIRTCHRSRSGARNRVSHVKAHLRALPLLCEDRHKARARSVVPGGSRVFEPPTSADRTLSARQCHLVGDIIRQ